MNAWIWIQAKFGRIVSAAGVLLSSVEGFDITPIKDPVEAIVGHVWVLRITVALFIFSYLRHQYVANQHPKEK